MNKSFQINKFRTNQIEQTDNILIIGMRNTGKSFIIRDLLYNINNNNNNLKIPFGTIISTTEGCNQFYEKFIPQILIFDELSVDLLKLLVKRQNLIKNKIENGENIESPSFIVFDDCMYDKESVNNIYYYHLIKNRKIYKNLILTSFQYCINIDDRLKDELDYLFILRESFEKERYKIYSKYCSFIPSFDYFNHFMNNCTNNYECLIIDLKNKHLNWYERIFWYKSEIYNDFKICDKDIWDYSKQKLKRDIDNLDVNNIQNYDFYKEYKKDLMKKYKFLSKIINYNN